MIIRHGRVGVSVFSGESRVVQLTQRLLVRRERQCFSILWRISCGATVEGQFAYDMKVVFQYSLANLVWCNRSLDSFSGATAGCFSILWRISCGATFCAVSKKSKTLPFQYSLANLVWCNSSPAPPMQKLSSSFSILWRISCGATCAIATDGTLAKWFQYSLANLVWCNPGSMCFCPATGFVSVFSGESRVVQRGNCSTSTSASWCFSILWRISCGATLLIITM